MAPSSDQPASRNPASDTRAFDDPRANDPDTTRSGTDLRAFVGQVQRRCGIDLESEAETLARVTLRKMGGRISSGQARDLAKALPAELAAEITSQNTAQARALDKTELVDQVSAEVHSVDSDTVESQIMAVLSTLKQWAPRGEIEDTIAQLPPQAAALFG